MGERTEHAVDASIGERIREIRVWRGLRQRPLAGLVGISQAYLSKIENGLAAVDRRSLLEAFARALRVAPSDLTGTTGGFRMRPRPEEDRALMPLRLALSEIEVIGERVGGPVPEWPQVAVQVQALDRARDGADYEALSAMMPELIRDLHASLAGRHRREALVGLTHCYQGSQGAAAALGAPDLGHVAALHLRMITARLDGPEWEGLAAWGQVQAIGSSARDQAYDVSRRTAEELAPYLAQPAVAEIAGQLHLQAGLASTVLGNHGQALDHLAEADEITRRPDVGAANFGRLWFGRGNVAIWRTMLAVEAGDGGRAAEIARGVDPDSLPPSANRRAAWHIDVGRGLAMDRRDEDALRAFQIAQKLAPQRTQGNPWVRETVTVMLERARRESTARDLRGMAFWLGIGR